MESEEARESPSNMRTAGFWSIYFLGISMAANGLFINWNHGLHHGFVTYIVCLTVISCTFLVLTFCAAELTSILPFSGGPYGFARVSAGPFIGYLIGCCDAFRNIVLIAQSIWWFGEILGNICGTGKEYHPLYWLIFFIPSLLIDHSGPKYFWVVIAIGASITLFSAVLYLLVASPHMDFQQYALVPNDSGRVNFSEFTETLRFSLSGFTGLMMLPLACKETINPKQTIPKAQLAAVCTMIVLSFLILIGCCATSPGTASLWETIVPLSYGYAQGFRVSRRAGEAFSLVPLYVTAFGYLYSYSRLLCAMADSKLLPEFLGLVRGKRDSPYSAQLTGNLLSFVVMLLIWLSTGAIEHLSVAGFYGNIAVYLGVLGSFAIFRTRFTSLVRECRNPLGIHGAYIAMAVFALPLIYALGYTKESYISVAIFLGVILVSSAYYFLVAHRRQAYSKDEQEVMLVVYVMKSNQRKRQAKNMSRLKHKPMSHVSSSSRGLAPGSESLSESHSAEGESAPDVAELSLGDSFTKLPAEQKPTSFSVRVTARSSNSGSHGPVSRRVGADDKLGIIDSLFRAVAGDGSARIHTSDTESLAEGVTSGGATGVYGDHPAGSKPSDPHTIHTPHTSAALALACSSDADDGPLSASADPLPASADPLPASADPLPASADPLPASADPLPASADPHSFVVPGGV